MGFEWFRMTRTEICFLYGANQRELIACEAVVCIKWLRVCGIASAARYARVLLTPLLSGTRHVASVDRILAFLQNQEMERVDLPLSILFGLDTYTNW